MLTARRRPLLSSSTRWREDDTVPHKLRHYIDPASKTRTVTTTTTTPTAYRQQRWLGSDRAGDIHALNCHGNGLGSRRSLATADREKYTDGKKKDRGNLYTSDISPTSCNLAAESITLLAAPLCGRGPEKTSETGRKIGGG
jgi:hypothetical protein